jgi:acetylornithine deacetylase/succinyl-diaminopimelate desuccinylase family protein
MTSQSLLRDLVRLPSVNPMGRSWADDSILYEHRVTDYLEAFFRKVGVPFERQTIAPKRDNIVARFESPGATCTYLFEVHQDTVPVEAMIVEPFGGEVREGRIYGRGACDVKGSMAVMLSVLERLVKQKPKGAGNLVLACTVDEEHTFLGVQELVKSVKADFAVVAEPTMLQIVDAHKGVVRWKVRTPGRACHSSRPDQGINAIYRMGKLLTAIEEFAAKLGTTHRDARLGPATLSVGRIEGGVSVNTVPDDCVIEIDRRLLPGEDPHAAPRELDKFLLSHPAIDFPFKSEPVWLACPALNPKNAREITERLGRAINAVAGSHQVLSVPFGTDASTIANANIPAVVFGPGDIAQAHTCDEWVALDQLEKAEEILFKLVANEV